MIFFLFSSFLNKEISVRPKAQTVISMDRNAPPPLRCPKGFILVFFKEREREEGKKLKKNNNKMKILKIRTFLYNLIFYFNKGIYYV